MAEEAKTSEKHEKPKLINPNLFLDTTKTTPPRTSSSIPSSPVSGLRKSSSIRQNCLCSPTTHAGSFRCRYHRNSGLPRNSMSVGSKLSELANKSSPICDSLHTRLITGHSQGS